MSFIFTSKLATRHPLLLIFACLSACSAVGPDYRQPPVATGSGWSQQRPALPVDEQRLSRWWKDLGDPELERLVEAALARNLDLRQAQTSIEDARAALGRATAAGRPSVSVSGSIQQRRLSANSPEFNPMRPADQTVGDAGFDASWEIDLFGGQRRSRESASAGIEAAQADAIAVSLSVAAEVARTVLTIRGAVRELVARQASLEALSKTLSIARARLAQGDLSAADVQRIEAQHDRAAAALPAVESRARAARLGLGLLVGALPESEVGLAIDAAVPDRLLPIQVGERSDVLRRRPDVSAAERRLAAATAGIGVATAELFPKLTLSASAGFRSLGLSSIVETDSRRGAIGPLISWRFFDGGRVRAEIQAANSRQRLAALGYEKAVLSALTDAERALSAYEHSLLSVEAQRLASASVRKTLAAANQRFELGDNALFDVIDAEREWRDQEVLVVQANTAAAVDQVALFKALGGGWNSSPRMDEHVTSAGR